MSRAAWLVLGAVVGAGLVAGCGDASTSSAGGAPTSSGVVASPAPVPAPTRVRIPSIEADSSLIRTGMNPDGSPQVPDVRDPGQASWASWSPEPGAVGPAVLYGHVDGEVNGRRGVLGVFARLDALQAGQPIFVDRADGSTAVFVVSRVAAFPKASLDLRSGDDVARQVYGDVSGAQLRLVTCGGSFDHGARSYRDQVVVFAELDRTDGP